MIISLLILLIFAGCQLAASWNDLTSMTIPNWISLALLAGFFAVIPFTWQGWDVFGVHMMIGGICFVVGVGGFALGWMGGGDAKLFAATSIWWVWQDLLVYLIYTGIAGGVLAILLVGARKYMPVSQKTKPWLHRLLKDETKMPYGLALAFGAFMTLPHSDIFQYASSVLPHTLPK